MPSAAPPDQRLSRKSKGSCARYRAPGAANVPHRAAPWLGADMLAVLKSLLGHTNDQIRVLKDNSII